MQRAQEVRTKKSQGPIPFMQTVLVSSLLYGCSLKAMEPIRMLRFTSRLPCHSLYNAINY